MFGFPWDALAAAVVGAVLTVLGGRLVACEVHGWWWRRSLMPLQIRLPRTATVEDLAGWVGTLRTLLPGVRRWGLARPVCVEITGTHHGIRTVLWTPRRLQADVLAAISAAMPGARLDDDGPAHGAAAPPVRVRAAREARSTGAAEPLATDRAAETSRRVIAALQPLGPGEVVRVQWLLVGALAPRWLIRPTTPAAAVPALWKQGAPMFRVVCRVAVATGQGRRRAKGLVAGAWAALCQMNTPRSRIGRRWWLPGVVVGARVAGRMTPVGRWPMILTATELGGLLGLVAGESPLPGMPAGISRTVPPSVAMPTQGQIIGVSNYPNTRTVLRLTASDRLRHMWMIGPTGAGKSTLLAAMIGHDIARGDGVVVIDPRGDLIADVLDRVPDGRRDDVIVIDPTISDYAIGLNPLTAGPPEQAAGFTYHVLHSVYAKSWGPRTADIVRACLLTLTNTTGPHGAAYTLMEVPTLLTDATFRRAVTGRPMSTELAAFWQWYESMPAALQLTVISPVLNKLRTFTLSTALRSLLGQSAGVDFAHVMATRKIVLVALKKGLLGSEVSGLVGSLVMSSVWQAALARANMPPAKRRPFWLYIDEFQDVLKLPLDLADMCAQARGLGLGLTLAHQFMDQLPRQLKSSILGTVRTHLAFQLGHSDAKDLAQSFTPLTADDLRSLGAYEIALRPCVGGATLMPVTGTTYPLPDPTTDGAALADDSRRRYGHSAADIDAQITARTRAAAPLPPRIGRTPDTDDGPVVDESGSQGASL
ncbi:MAG: type IV secretory system conjugative DNA transfer family protein [Pseudonocardia sp.]